MLRPTVRLFPWEISPFVGQCKRSTKSPLNDMCLSEEQRQFRNGIAKFADAEVAPIASRIDEKDLNEGIKNLWKKFGDMGLLGLTVPEKYGGLNQGVVAQCIAMEEISRASGSVGLSYGAHSNLCVNQLVRHATPKQAEKYLPGLVSGELIGALAMSETEAGSDVVAMKTRGRNCGDHFILSGSKFWITNGPDADVIIVYAKTGTEGSDTDRRISAFIIETSQPGFKVGQKIRKLGMRGSHTSEIILEDYKVPASNLLGELNRGVYVMMSGLDIERMVLAAGPVGLMQAACDVAFAYAQSRKTFGVQISEHGQIQAKMADMYTRTQANRSYLYSLAKMFDDARANKNRSAARKSSLLSVECAAVILSAAEAATQVALDAIQILGGAGYTEDYPASRIMRDAKLYEIGAGTSEIRRMLIARGIDAFYKQAGE